MAMTLKGIARFETAAGAAAEPKAAGTEVFAIAADGMARSTALYSKAVQTRLHVTRRGGSPMTANTNKLRGSRDKVRAYRERMRARGLRPIQIWVPDTRTAAFRTQAHRQSLAVAESELAGEDQDFIDAISESGEA